MDLSPLRKFEVVGPDAEALLQTAVTRNIRKLATGQVVYTAVCNETGGMLDDATVFRLGPDKFRFVGGDEYDGTWLRQLAGRLNLDRVWVKHSTDHLHNIAVQGPKSRDLLRDLVWTPPTQPAFDSLGWFRFAIGRTGGPEGLPLIISRTGYTGELGYELWCHPGDAPALWDLVWEAGAPHGLTPLGLEALDILRIEACLIFAGYEFCDQVDPFEAGIGFTVPLKTKEDDFTGRAALQRRKAAPQRTLVGLELEGNEPAAHGDCVHVGRSQVGVITSGTRSPILRKNIALCRMAVEYSEIGTAVDVGKLDGHRKRIPATVVRFPFYDPDKTRPAPDPPAPDPAQDRDPAYTSHPYKFDEIRAARSSELGGARIARGLNRTAGPCTPRIATSVPAGPGPAPRLRSGPPPARRGPGPSPVPGPGDLDLQHAPVQDRPLGVSSQALGQRAAVGEEHLAYRRGVRDAGAAHLRHTAHRQLALHEVQRECLVLAGN